MQSTHAIVSENAHTNQPESNKTGPAEDPQHRHKQASAHSTTTWNKIRNIWHLFVPTPTQYVHS